MSNKWTEEQLSAINCRNANVLVAAAAGSGKTAVLVERLINKIIEDKVDIDKMLVCTFTNAAASEMKERILDRIYKEIETYPEDLHLQKQITLINNANISTIHSFCLEVIRNYFYEIDISPNFRIGDSAEVALLEQEVLEEFFEELYEENNQDLIKLVNMYGGYKGDEKLKEIILKIFQYIQSSPEPNEWLKQKVDMFNINNDIDFSETIWGKVILDNVKEEIQDLISNMKNILLELKKENDVDKIVELISNNINTLERILNSSTWDEMVSAMNLSFGRWSQSKNLIVTETIEKARKTREDVTAKIKELKNESLIGTSKEVIEDIAEMYDILKKIENLILEFSKRLIKAKKEKNIVDFSDIEHYALKILIKDNKPSEIAKKYQERFNEIAIDEYQDINLVQEKILTSVSKGNNIFRVGDVKQSIYKFRQARPELFLDKYAKYVDIDKNNILKTDSKIKLFKNFRSRENILNYTNIIFKDIMSKKFGEIEYNEQEYLNVGNKFGEADAGIKTLNEKIELNIINLMNDEDIDDDEIEELDESVIEDRVECEATFVANRIKKIMEDNYYVCNKDNTYRKLQFKDIAILLMAPKSKAEVYEKALNNLNFPVYSDISSSYFDSIEIQTVMNLLKIIDNPNNDIPLVSILRSSIGGFTDNELVEIRVTNKKASFYDALINVKNESKNEKLVGKVDKFLKLLEDLQIKSEYLKLDELIWYIYEKTGFYDYVSVMPNGNLKTANMKLLFEKAKDYEKASFKGLYNFINYIDRVKNRNRR